MRVRGRQLVALLLANGWKVHRDSRHGLWLIKKTADGTITTTVKDNDEVIPPGTLAAILGPKQTGLGSSGLRRLLASRTKRTK